MDDNQWEPDEEFFLKLTLIPGRDSEEVRLGRTSIMEITILNDDGTICSGKINVCSPLRSPEREKVTVKTKYILMKYMTTPLLWFQNF